MLIEQARAFLAIYHAEHLQTAAKLVEEEQWIQSEIPARTCRDVDLLVSSATQSGTSDSGLTLRAGGPHTDGTKEQSYSGPEYAKTLSIEDQNFVLVHATISILDMLCSYVKLLITLETVVNDVMAKIIEFLKVSQACIGICKNGADQTDSVVNKGFQLTDLPSRTRCGRHAFRWPEKHHGETPR